MKNVLILGAGSDVGQSLARLFASKSYSIHIAGRDMELLESFKKDLEIRYSVAVNFSYFDADDFSNHDSFLKNLNQTPDIAIYVIGYMGQKKPMDTDWEDTLRIVSANYLGAVSIFNRLAKAMKNRKSGILIGISSVAGERGRQSNYLYGSAKAGFSTYLSGLRNALISHGVRVITVKPGFINTSMTENLKLPPLLTAQPDEVALAIYKSIQSGKDILYVRFFWRTIMWIIRNIPEKIFKKLSL